MRQVARHIYIKELLDGEYEEREGWDPNILHTARGDIARCNVIGVLITLSGQSAIEDGTGQVSLRAFDPVPGIDSCSSGDVVQVIGRPRQYQSQIYIIPEAVRKIDSGWARLRKEELGVVLEREHKQPLVEKPVVKDDDVLENKADLIISVIAGLDDGDGAAIDEVIEQSGLGDSAERIIAQLLLDGEIFEIKPGVVKVL